jgi:hypothetical protein
MVTAAEAVCVICGMVTAAAAGMVTAAAAVCVMVIAAAAVCVIRGMVTAAAADMVTAAAAVCVMVTASAAVCVMEGTRQGRVVAAALCPVTEQRLVPKWLRNHFQLLPLYCVAEAFEDTTLSTNINPKLNGIGLIYI